MHADELIACAKYLYDRPESQRTQTDLKRAMSTLYYAMFVELATTCANCIAGFDPAVRGERAWKQSYRALEHKYSKGQCRQIFGRNFPKPIEDFANCYSTMQLKRHRSDYSPDTIIRDTDFQRSIGNVRKCIKGLRDADEKHKRAFVAFVLLKKRPD